MLRLFVLIVLCFVIFLGVMAFIPRPVKSLQDTEEVDVPSTPASFLAGRPTDELRNSFFYSLDSRTGFVTYNNGGKFPDRTPSPVNYAHGQTITMGPPRHWHGFESPDLRHNNDTYGGTMAMRNAPTEHASVISGRRRVDPFHHNLLGNLSPPPTSIHSRARPVVGGKNSSIAENRLNQSSAFPGPKHDALSPIALQGSPPPVTTPRDFATEHTPTLYSAHSHYLVPVSPGDHSQQEQTYPDRARPETPSIYSFHSSAASVHPMWEESTPHIPPLPDFARLRGSSPYLGLKDPSSRNNAPFATSGSNTPRTVTPKLFEPHGTMQHYGAPRAHRPHHPPVKESSGSVLGEAVMGWIRGSSGSLYSS
jgi:hypothetical protein